MSARRELPPRLARAERANEPDFCGTTLSLAKLVQYGVLPLLLYMTFAAMLETPEAMRTRGLAQMEAGQLKAATESFKKVLVFLLRVIKAIARLLLFASSMLEHCIETKRSPRLRENILSADGTICW